LRQPTVSAGWSPRQSSQTKRGRLLSRPSGWRPPVKKPADRDPEVPSPRTGEGPQTGTSGNLPVRPGRRVGSLDSSPTGMGARAAKKRLWHAGDSSGVRRRGWLGSSGRWANLGIGRGSRALCTGQASSRRGGRPAFLGWLPTLSLSAFPRPPVSIRLHQHLPPTSPACSAPPLVGQLKAGRAVEEEEPVCSSWAGSALSSAPRSISLVRRGPAARPRLRNGVQWTCVEPRTAGSEAT